MTDAEYFNNIANCMRAGDGKGAISVISRIRAEARAEALKEAADRAEKWYRQKEYQEDMAALSETRIDQLRAAILGNEPKELECSTCGRKESAPYEEGDSCYCGGKFFADEPKEERQGCFRCRNRPQPGESSPLCKSCRLIVGKNYDPMPLSDEPKEERGAEVGDIVTWTNSHGARMIGIFGREITQGDAIILMRRAEVERRIEEAGR